MAEFVLIGIDSKSWKYFKAYCALREMTMKQELLRHIDAVALAFKVSQGLLKKIDDPEGKTEIKFLNLDV